MKAALRRGVEPLSAARQTACDTGRITQDVGTRGRIRTCGETINRRPRCQLRHPGRSDVPARATPWGNTGRRTPFRVPPGNRTRLSCLEGKVLAARTAVRMERPAGTAPTPPTWQAGVPLTTPWPQWSSAPDLHRHVTRLQLAAYLFGPAEQRSPQEDSNLRAGVRSAGRDPLAVGMAPDGGHRERDPRGSVRACWAGGSAAAPKAASRRAAACR